MTRPEAERQQAVLEILQNFRGIDPLKELFCSELNYQHKNQHLSRRGWSDTAASVLAEDPVVFAAGGQDNDFKIIYARLASDRLLLGHERPVVSRLLRDHPYSLFVFSNEAQDRWHFLNIKYTQETAKRRLFRRITIGPEERLRTASERLAMLDLDEISPGLFGAPPLAIQQVHDEAFDVEAVTKAFYDEYKAVFRSLQNNLGKQTGDQAWAHDYALQFLNRCMFLYFIQRKRWLGGNTEFLRVFWESYQRFGQARDAFFEKWLKVLFFEAFNNRFHGGHAHFPKEIQETLALAPYLNGGLFEKNDLDQKFAFTITDDQFKQVFKFLEHYNFTIAEDSPLDQEVAVDAEMLGRVYESLVNVSEEADERGDAGIFYTPRTEIDLMCRLALVDHLANRLGQERKNLLYEAVFALEPEEKAAADQALTQENLWPILNDHLRQITVVDPACGSGSFLVGMLHILDDLQDRAGQQLGLAETSYDRKKRIIGQSLYGVDVKDWACHVAELRLWLALIIDSEFTPEELHIRREPLLPYFTFKIRQGDSLVQELGGLNIGHLTGRAEVPPALKGRLTSLKKEKLNFYDNKESARFKSEAELKAEELRLFREILDYRGQDLDNQRKERKRLLTNFQLDAYTGEIRPQDQKAAASLQAEIAALTAELEQIHQARAALNGPKDVPFVWDIAFVEVFAGERKGFDIVIGNPPYVRHQLISDPQLPREKVTAENKKEYKAKLMKSVYAAWPDFFGRDPDRPARKFDAKSDLYVYFYFHGLKLLNDKGSFCFITSNSWLDVGYGANLQEFLLKHGQVKMIIDNKVKRSFAEADVNTIIALLAPPNAVAGQPEDKTARFVLFTAPFEHILSAVIFQEIEDAQEKRTTQEYRVFPIRQDRLLADGGGLAEDEAGEATVDQKKGKPVSGPLIKVARYIGNKWGGKYLRAPDIYYVILDKMRSKAVFLDSICRVNEGKPTGANDFFYVTQEVAQRFRIEKEFLRPGLMKTRDANRFVIKQKDIYRFFLAVSSPKPALLGKHVFEYILYGESLGLHKRSTYKTQSLWYVFSAREPAQLVLPCGIGAKFFCAKNYAEAITSNSFTELRFYTETKEMVNVVWAQMNSCISWLYSELMGRATLGGGMLKIDPYDYRKILVLGLDFFPSDLPELDRTVGNIHEELRAEDRRSLDTIIFDSLGLTLGEREAVYEAVISLVQARLKKAESLDLKDRKRLAATDKTGGVWAGLLEDQDDRE